MKLTENTMMALKNLSNNKARSFLTMLGIIIGVGAVITMVSLGDGAKGEITQTISEMGSNLIIVSPGKKSGQRFNNQTVDLLEESLNNIQTVAAAARSSRLVEAGGNNAETVIVGITPEYGIVRNYQVAYGSFLNESDISGRKKVAVIGSSVAEELFPGRNPIGEELRLGNVRLEIIGVLQTKGQAGFGSGDDLIFLPLTTAQERIFGHKRLSEINLQVADATLVNEAYRQAQAILMAEYQDEDKFSVSNMAEMLTAVEEMTGTMTMLLAGIAGISLLVGGIGIMNIMLVSVTERIREIGIRKAIGARSQEILMLFLIEAVTLSLLGGVIGIGWGGGLAILLGKFLGWQIQISGNAVITAFGFSFLVGLFFGVYPAYKASGLHPIEALRHE